MDLVRSKQKSGDLHPFTFLSESFIFDPTTHSIFSVQDINSKELQQEIEKSLQKGYFTRSVPNQFSDTRVFKSLCLIITQKCNFRCTYCFEKGKKTTSSEDVMSIEIGKKSLDLITNLSKNRINIEVDFFGGEPLLYMDTLMKIVGYGRELEKKYNKIFWFSLTTNASLLTDKMIDFLKQENISLILSIDGCEKNHNKYRVYENGRGTFVDTLKGIQKVIQSGHEGYYTRGTYTKETSDFLDQIFYLENIGINQISFEPVVSSDPAIGFSQEDLPLLKKQYEELAKEYLIHRETNKNLRFYHFEVDLEEGACLPKLLTSCGAGVEYLSVSPNGKLYPCHQFDGNSEYELGNVEQGIQNHPLVEEFRDLTQVAKKEKCMLCWARTLCGGGCLANNLTINNNLSSLYDVGCEIQKIRLEAALYVQTKLKKLKI
jgi:uncharacterized protein